MKKVILVAICVLLVCTVILFLALAADDIFFLILMANIGEKTVVQTLVSPDGKYEARVIDIDQGALGGDTVVEVERIGTLTKAKQIYIGEWGEYRTMEIYWKNNYCLVINGVEYPIK